MKYNFRRNDKRFRQFAVGQSREIKKSIDQRVIGRLQICRHFIPTSVKIFANFANVNSCTGNDQGGGQSDVGREARRFRRRL